MSSRVESPSARDVASESTLDACESHTATPTPMPIPGPGEDEHPEPTPTPRSQERPAQTSSERRPASDGFGVTSDDRVPSSNICGRKTGHVLCTNVKVAARSWKLLRQAETLIPKVRKERIEPNEPGWSGYKARRTKRSLVELIGKIGQLAARAELKEANSKNSGLDSATARKARRLISQGNLSSSSRILLPERSADERT